MARSVALSGFGFWSGIDVVVEFRPAAPNTGITFVRRDLPGTPRIPASVDMRCDVPRRTNLSVRGDGGREASVEMVEHLLAACFAQQIDNCEVWVDGAEIPGLDGSSRAFFEILEVAGRVDQPDLRRQICILEPLRVAAGKTWIEALPAVRPGLHLEYHLEYGANRAIGSQQRSVTIDTETFRTELASSRTFLLETEADQLRASGLGMRPTNQDVLVFTDEGPLENTLRFDDECVRHKLLDLVGDLSLAGCDIQGKVVAHQTGHHLNSQIVRLLLESCDGQMELRKSA